MAKTSVDILINAKDNASKQLNDIAKSTGAMNNSLSKMAGGAKKLVGGLAAVGVGLLAFSKMKGLLTDGAAALSLIHI